ncbi:MAG TPA: hypothetical protein VE553_10105 [Candidatus Binatia bacterium]|jgi:hypothetical protein|nr:hypothetical protein [Candidatus Binatia bacterium]
MSSKTRSFGSLELEVEQPTELSFADLEEWVLWQFPRAHGGWLCGAAHPAEPAFGWIPARIQPHKKRVILYAHRAEPLGTPEEAADWIASLRDH